LGKKGVRILGVNDYAVDQSPEEDLAEEEVRMKE
jgi:hypothetical protein